MNKIIFSKISILICLIVAIIFSIPLSNSMKSTACSKIAYAEVFDESASPAIFVGKETTTLNGDTIVSPEATAVIALLLNPYIRVAIDNYFGEPTQYALYDATIKEISQVNNDFIYKVTISVPTFHGAHNPPYGIETMTFTIRSGGAVLNDYVHQNV